MGQSALLKLHLLFETKFYLIFSQFKVAITNSFIQLKKNSGYLLHHSLLTLQ